MKRDFLDFALLRPTTLSDKLVLLYMYYHRQYKGGIPTIKQIASGLGVEVQDIKDVYISLRDNGFLIGDKPPYQLVEPHITRFPRVDSEDREQEAELYTKLLADILYSYRMGKSKNPRAIFKRYDKNTPAWSVLRKVSDYLENLYPEMSDEDRGVVYREYITVVSEFAETRKFQLYTNQYCSEWAKETYENYLMNKNASERDDNPEKTYSFAEDYLNILSGKSIEKNAMTVGNLLNDKGTRLMLQRGRQCADSCGMKYSHYIRAQFEYFEKSFNKVPELSQLSTPNAVTRALGWLATAFPSGR